MNRKDQLKVKMSDSARVSLNSAMQFMRKANSVLGLNYSHVHAALNNFHLCDISQAVANAQESSAMATDNFGMDSGLKSLSDILLIALQFWQNGTSDDDCLRFASASEHVARYGGWFEIYALCLETRVENCLLQNGYDSAAKAVEWAEQLGAERSMRRLQEHAETMSLFVAIRNPAQCGNHALAKRIQMRTPVGRWRDERFFWRTHTYACLALAEYHSETDASASISYYNDAIDCCREYEVLAQLELGRANKQIANALDMTEHTVKFHLKNIFKKLSVSRRTEARVVARENDLIQSMTAGMV